MKKIFQGVAFIIILIGAFWVGMQWGSLSNIPEIDYKQIVPSQVPDLVPDSAPVVQPISSEVIIPVVPVASEEKTATTPEIAPVDLPKIKDEKIIHYSSKYFQYGFDIPASIYYSAFGASDGAQHTVAIAKEIPETFEDGAVKVYFYGKKVVSKLKNAQNGRYEDPAGKYIYILLGGQYSVKIEASDIKNSVVQKIVQTIALES